MTASPRTALAGEWLRERYLVQKQSTQQIADESGWSSQYVRERLREHGIPLRPPGGGNKAGDILDSDTLRRWIDQGLSVDEVMQRSGYSRTGVYKLLRRHGISSAAPPAEVEDSVRLAEIARLYRDDRLSLRAIGQRYGCGADWARARVAASGVPLRSGGRTRSPAADDPSTLRRFLADGLSIDQIAARVSRMPATVREWLRAYAIDPPPRPRRGPTPLDPETLHRLYVDQRHIIDEIAAQLQVSTHRVRKGLIAAGIARRTPGTRAAGPDQISEEQLRELYVRDQRSTAAIAAKLGCSRTRVRTALRRAEIPQRRPLRAPVFDLDEATLRQLYIAERLDDTGIGQRYHVPAHRVRMRRRALGVRRPSPAPPHPARPDTPPRAVLEQLYTHGHRTLAQIARAHHTASPVVRRWLTEAGIAVRPRTSRAHRKALDLDAVRELYEVHEWVAVDVAAELDTTQYLVLRCLHDNGIAVRRGGARRHLELDDSDRLLETLYGDADVSALLSRHCIPRREQAGSITDRFPEPVVLSEALLREAYVGVGLSARHIELLTGQPAGQILDALHAKGIPVRPGGASPWLRYQREQRRRTSRTPRQPRQASKRRAAGIAGAGGASSST